MQDKTNLDKIDQTITALIDQIDYLISDIQIDKKIRGTNKYDLTKDKIRSNSDVVWQLSNSITNLVSAKQHLSFSDKKTTSLIDLGLGITPKGDK